MTRPLNIALLGATGSIGRQTLDVIDRNPGRFKLFGLTEGRRSSNRKAEYLVQGQAGEEGFDAQVEAMVTDPRCDLVVVAIPGARALPPTLSALRAGKEVALATKEVLVMAGALVMKAAGAGRAQDALPERQGIRPIDSEHSAIWQCLWGEERENVRRLIITASGGPFWAHPDVDLDQVTVEQALNHPRWSMGPKVTIDSATLMNKGLEIIEARWLFDLKPDQVQVLVHPQSIVHSMVEYIDGSVIAQLGVADMGVPILYALTYPERRPTPAARLDLTRIGQLTFFEPDTERFPCLRLARAALECGGSAPVVLNAANEMAVAAFLDRKIGFTRIPELIERVLAEVPVGELRSIEECVAIDADARRRVQRSVDTLAGGK